MRLSCPNCSTQYDVPDGALPASGQHVQCTECHTRWFARGAEPRPRLSEDQILERLENRRPLTLVSGGTPRPGPDPAPVPESEAAPQTEPEPDPEPAKAFVWEGRSPEPPAEASDAAATPEPAAGDSQGFAAGLVAALALGLLALALYAAAEWLASRAPFAAPLLDGYVAAVDAVRETLAGAMGTRD